MAPLAAQILTTIVITIISIIITFYFTTRSNIKRFNLEIDAAISIHNKIYHESTVYSIIEKFMDKHILTCEASKCLPEIKELQINMKGALIFLVTKAGGNPSDLGLFE